VAGQESQWVRVRARSADPRPQRPRNQKRPAMKAFGPDTVAVMLRQGFGVALAQQQAVLVRHAATACNPCARRRPAQDPRRLSLEFSRPMEALLGGSPASSLKPRRSLQPAGPVQPPVAVAAGRRAIAGPLVLELTRSRSPRARPPLVAAGAGIPAPTCSRWCRWNGGEQVNRCASTMGAWTRSPRSGRRSRSSNPWPTGWRPWPSCRDLEGQSQVWAAADQPGKPGGAA